MANDTDRNDVASAVAPADAPRVPEGADTSATQLVHEADARARVVTFDVVLAVALLTTSYFGIGDVVRGRAVPALISLVLAAVFVTMLAVNTYSQRFRHLGNIAFVAFVGAVFLALLAARYPDPAIVFWCFTFPLAAVFLLGHGAGAVALVAFDLGVAVVFAVDINTQGSYYTYDFAIRYCAVMLVLSVMASYYESLRARSLAQVRAANQSLEQRVDEKTRALVDNQARLRQAEKLEAIGLLAGGIAHDFNNQLTGILGMADLIRSIAEDRADVREYAAKIVACAERSAALTGQLLAFARKGNVLHKAVDVHAVVDEVISLIGRTIDKNIVVQRELAAAASTVTGDPALLESAVLNLALNARDAMPRGGELTFATSVVDIEGPQCRAFSPELVPGRYVRLTVADTGCGMSGDVRSRIFEPFFTTKERGKGTGMGLPAVYGTVLSHKGAVTVASEVGRGSTFSIFLPLLPGAAPAAAPDAGTPGTPRLRGRVLLVDDEPVVAESMKTMLESLGLEVTVRHGGRKPVEFYRLHPHAVDLVILDMIMPAMSGRDTFAALQQIDPGVVVLLASGYSLEGEARGILDMGVRSFIQKPFNLATLRETLAGLLGRSPV